MVFAFSSTQERKTKRGKIEIKSCVTAQRLISSSGLNQFCHQVTKIYTASVVIKHCFQFPSTSYEIKNNKILLYSRDTNNPHQTMSNVQFEQHARFIQESLNHEIQNHLQCPLSFGEKLILLFSCKMDQLGNLISDVLIDSIFRLRCSQKMVLWNDFLFLSVRAFMKERNQVGRKSTFS